MAKNYCGSKRADAYAEVLLPFIDELVKIWVLGVEGLNFISFVLLLHLLHIDLVVLLCFLDDDL